MMLSVLDPPIDFNRRGIHKYYIWESINKPGEFVMIDSYDENTNHVNFSNSVSGEKYATPLSNFKRHYIEVRPATIEF